MIDPAEAAICARRGHDGYLSKGWQQCKWCKTWVREVRTREEREDEPPEAEQDQTKILFKKLQGDTDG